MKDGGVNGATPNTNAATAGYIAVNATSGEHALIRFDNLFGSGPSQIPVGSIVTSASVSLYLSGVASVQALPSCIACSWPGRTRRPTWLLQSPLAVRATAQRPRLS